MIGTTPCTLIDCILCFTRASLNLFIASTIFPELARSSGSDTSDSDAPVSPAGSRDRSPVPHAVAAPAVAAVGAVGAVAAMGAVGAAGSEEDPDALAAPAEATASSELPVVFCDVLTCKQPARFACVTCGQLCVAHDDLFHKAKNFRDHPPRQELAVDKVNVYSRNQKDFRYQTPAADPAQPDEEDEKTALLVGYARDLDATAVTCTGVHAS